MCLSVFFLLSKSKKKKWGIMNNEVVWITFHWKCNLNISIIIVNYFLYSSSWSNDTQYVKMSPLTDTLVIIQQKITLYIYPIWLIFGVTGCLLNLIVFSRRHLRTTSCSICKYMDLRLNFMSIIYIFVDRFFCCVCRSFIHIIYWYWSSIV